MPYYGDEFQYITYDNDEDYVLVYTDGACSNNGKPYAKAGIGVWFSNYHRLNASRPVHGNPTNNVAEIEAAIEAVEIAYHEGITHLHIRTDSRFLIDSMTKWIHCWIRRDWTRSDGQPLINKNEFQELLRVMELLDDVQFDFVPAHAGDYGNEKADALARAGARAYQYY